MPFICPAKEFKQITMGKGDKKTKRGKIVKGTYGVRRSKRKYKAKNKKHTVESVNKEDKK